MTSARIPAETLHARINQLRHQIATLEGGLDHDAKPEALVRTLAECRATVNAMLAELTLPHASGRDEGPAWKQSAAHMTRDL